MNLQNMRLKIALLTLVSSAFGISLLGAFESHHFYRAQNLSLPDGEGEIRSAAIDPTNGYGYFGTSNGKVVKIRLSDFIHVGTITVGDEAEAVTSAFFDPVSGLAYFGIQASPGKLIKIQLSDDSVVDTVALGQETLQAILLDLQQGFAYFGVQTYVSGSRQLKLLKYQLSDFTQVGTLYLATDGSFITQALLDEHNGHAYVTTMVYPTFTQYSVASYPFFRNPEPRFPLPPPPPPPTNQRATLLKIRLSDFTIQGTKVIGQDPIATSLLDSSGGFLYLGSNTSPGRILKIRLPDFTWQSTLTLASGEDYLKSATLDVTNNLAYFGTGTSPGKVVKVNLSDFSRVERVTLEAGENDLRAALFDPITHSVYFGTASGPTKVVKIDTSLAKDSLYKTIDGGGGILSFQDSDIPIHVEIPSGAFPEPVIMTLSIPKDYPTDSSQELKGLRIGFDITLNKLLIPSRPVRISISKVLSDDFGAITVARFEEDAKEWLSLPTGTSSFGLSVEVDHFSLFQVMQKKEILPQALPQAQVFPNPFRPAKGHTEVTFNNLMPNTMIKIYTMAGELIQTS